MARLIPRGFSGPPSTGRSRHQRPQAATRRLNDAGLAIVDTVDSSDEPRALAHCYGLAATDHDVAVAGPPAGL